MPISRFLTHRVAILRRVAVLDGMGQPTLDDYGQPVTVTNTIASDVPASIQPKTARERAAFSQAGPATSNHTVYLLPRDLTTADAIYHDPAACPMPVDLPEGTYEIAAVPQAAGAGHHLEVDASLVGSPEPAEAGPKGGSGS